MIEDSRQKLDTVADNHCINLNIEGKIIKRVDHAKSLGLYIDKNLSWSKHIEEISKKISSGIGALKRIRSFIFQNNAVQIRYINSIQLPLFISHRGVQSVL